ncbi:MAG: DUF916 and DUF3324 domain-containing protein [Oscillospiraceae bacterium]|nr:DUF916 and DUF3324 domain-containing protein [Oscillospiraceae bacterium]
MRTLKSILTTAIVLLSTALLGITAEAAGGYSISPELPDNQIPETHGFFDLYVSAGDQQITMFIVNDNDFEATFEINHFAVSTNMNGVLDYTAPAIADESLKYNFADIASLGVDSKVTVPANTSLPVTLNLNIPQGGFDGVVLGAVHFLRDATEEELDNSGMFVNRFAHVMIVRLQERGAAEVAPDFMLGDVRAETINYTAAIVAELRNPMPRLSMGAKVSAEIFASDYDAPIFSVTDMDVDFAPNTVFPLTISDEAGYGLHPGDYLGKFKITFDDRTWEFEREFHIAPTTAAEVNAAALNQVNHVPQYATEKTIIYIFIGAGILLATLIITFVAVRGRKSYKRDLERLHEAVQYSK